MEIGRLDHSDTHGRFRNLLGSMRVTSVSCSKRNEYELSWQARSGIRTERTRVWMANRKYIAAE